MNKKVICFTHTDLDGVGVAVVSSIFAKTKAIDFECHRCNYGDINDTVVKVLESTPIASIADVIIGDISVNEEIAVYLNNLYTSGVSVILRDHHATAEWLNKYEWAKVSEHKDGILRCGTWFMANDGLLFGTSHTTEKTKLMLKSFVDTVDDWDTWKWKENNNNYACELNSLFQVLGFDDFLEYTEELLYYSFNTIDSPEDLFSDYGKTVIKVHNKQIEKAVRTCENDLLTSYLSVQSHGKSKKTYTVGTVFINQNTSEIADKILTNHPELDILMIMSFPRSISLRTQKQLDIPLGDLAKMLTGAGGGHTRSAGATISKRKMTKLLKQGVAAFSHEKVTIQSLED